MRKFRGKFAENFLQWPLPERPHKWSGPDSFWKCTFISKLQTHPNLHSPVWVGSKGWSSPARGYKFGCVCFYMAGHEDAWAMTGHIGTNTPKFVPPRWGRPPFWPYSNGAVQIRVGLALADFIIEITPDFPQSEIAATNFYDSGGSLGEELGEELGEIFCAFLCLICCTEWMTHKSSPKIPPNLSLHVLWLKIWNFISASFWGLGATRFYCREIVWSLCRLLLTVSHGRWGKTTPKSPELRLSGSIPAAWASIARVGNVRWSDNELRGCLLSSGIYALRIFWTRPFGDRPPEVAQNQARKRHINIFFLVRLGLGRPWVCPRDKPRVFLVLHSGSPVCPRDKPSLSLGQTRGEGAAEKFMC